jgi:hypothetical protein
LFIDILSHDKEIHVLGQQFFLKMEINSSWEINTLVINTYKKSKHADFIIFRQINTFIPNKKELPFAETTLQVVRVYSQALSYKYELNN